MPTSIEKAISTVLQQGEPLAVANVLVAYLKILGYMAPDDKELSVPHEALVAFEHALDKEPALSLRRQASKCSVLCQRMYTAEITQLRKEYWRERLGFVAAARCTCPTCGNTVAYRKEEFEDTEEEVITPPTRIKASRRKVKARRLAKRLRDARNIAPIDPYGPSTSALVL
ncbi:uncharacterized protein LAESUDRAFT_754745 [Laetiporus sulphureus 93-53]|uniref:Uncharacterized protein n=1 Tax=Laetiporus sulphureus 93-53 TaxID=1314785 RepID=A0A165HVT7_9APHY|nr:uncharacterized protein LAESUDRAFT_754745 [Laetiporus sulphureus 93-53]KZT12258.1 hypothetical protein LAESUDRAFT_754745 [Laetiporus sulphureus 93-53]